MDKCNLPSLSLPQIACYQMWQIVFNGTLRGRKGILVSIFVFIDDSLNRLSQVLCTMTNFIQKGLLNFSMDISVDISKDSANNRGPSLDDIFGPILNCISQLWVGMFFRGTWAGDRYGKAPQTHTHSTSSAHSHSSWGLELGAVSTLHKAVGW